MPSLTSLYSLQLKGNDVIDDEAVIKLTACNPDLEQLHLEGFRNLTHKSLLAAVRQCSKLADVKFGVRGGSKTDYAQRELLLELIREIRPTLEQVEVLF